MVVTVSLTLSFLHCSVLNMAYRHAAVSRMGCGCAGMLRTRRVAGGARAAGAASCDMNTPPGYCSFLGRPDVAPMLLPPHAALAQARVRTSSNHEVIEDGDIQELSGSDNLARDGHVLG